MVEGMKPSALLNELAAKAVVQMAVHCDLPGGDNA